MIKVHVPDRFIRQFRKLDKETRQIAAEEIILFREEPFHPSLNTHKLTKKFTGYYSFSISGDLRIIFRFTKKDYSEALFHSIGTHEIYK